MGILKYFLKSFLEKALQKLKFVYLNKSEFPTVKLHDENLHKIFIQQFFYS
jgi:hypothetical protein